MRLRSLLLRAVLVGGLVQGVTAWGFDLQGHRGARGLAPENTLAAFDAALAIGVNTLELDVGVSADGVVVIGHDALINADLARDGTGRWLREQGMAQGPRITALTLAQIQAFDVGRINPASRYATTFAKQVPADGERMPTLAALFERVKALKAEDVRFNIETKINPTKPEDSLAPLPFVQAILAVVDAHGMAHRVSLQSFDWRTLAVLAELRPKMPRVYLSAQRPTMDTLSDGAWTAGQKLSQHTSVPALVAHFSKGQGFTWAPHFADLTQALVALAQGMGLRVVPWTVNDPAAMTQLLEWRVDGIITDYPDVLRAVLATQGKALAPRIDVPPRK